MRNRMTSNKKTLENLYPKRRNRVPLSVEDEKTLTTETTCRVCQLRKWRYSYRVTTVIDLVTGTSRREKHPTDEEFRCAGCNTKATRANNLALRSILAVVKAKRTAKKVVAVLDEEEL